MIKTNIIYKKLNAEQNKINLLRYIVNKYDVKCKGLHIISKSSIVTNMGGGRTHLPLQAQEQKGDGL